MFVGITERLKYEIRNHITQMERAQVARVEEQVHPFPEGISTEEWCDRIERKAWGAAYKFKPELPEDWIINHSVAEAKIKDAVTELNLKLKCTGTSPMQFPPVYDGRWCPSVEFDVTDFDEDTQAKLRRYFDLMADTAKRYEQTREEINKLLERCKSVNEAVSLFPDLKYFLNDSIKERLEKKKRPDKQVAKLAGIDTALITSSMVIEQLHPKQEG